MQRIAVLGASGFVGTALVERLLAHGDAEVLPFIHSSGNAWRLARLGIRLFTTDVLSKERLRSDLKGCTHVVNCSRGSSQVMIKGIANVLDACAVNHVQRLVHISSVAVYGEQFSQEEICEDYPGRAARGTYGWTKMKQDRLVESAARRGLPCVVLCPPNISGPYSAFMLQLVEAMRAGQFALVDGGEKPCALIDVENLVRATCLALSCKEADGRRIFVSDWPPVEWRAIAESLADLCGDFPVVRSLSAEEAARLVAEEKPPRLSVLRAVKHLASSEVREALRKDRLLGSLEACAKDVARLLPSRIQDRLRNSANGNAPPLTDKRTAPYAKHLVRMQLRNVRYSLDRAAEVLGYRPPVDFAESVRAFQRWYRSYCGWEDGSWKLLRHLY